MKSRDWIYKILNVIYKWEVDELDDRELYMKIKEIIEEVEENESEMALVIDVLKDAVGEFRETKTINFIKGSANIILEV